MLIYTNIWQHHTTIPYYPINNIGETKKEGLKIKFFFSYEAFIMDDFACIVPNIVWTGLYCTLVYTVLYCTLVYTGLYCTLVV